MSSRPAIDRRTVLIGLAGLPLAACATVAPALPAMHFRDVRADTSEIARRGLPNWAAKVEAAATPALRSAFADLLDPKASAVLVVEIRSLSLESYTGGGPSLLPSGSSGGLGSGATDWVEGTLVIPAGKGRMEIRRPLMTSRPAAASGPWYAPDNEERRMRAVATTMAWWARREFAER